MKADAERMAEERAKQLEAEAKDQKALESQSEEKEDKDA